MTTSFCSNKRRRCTFITFAALAVGGALLAGCSKEAERNTCSDPPIEFDTTERADILRLASLRLEERTTLSAGEDPEKQLIVTLALSDRSLIIPQSRESASWSQACFVISGKSVRQCRGEAGGACGDGTCSSDQTCIDGSCVDCKALPLSAQSARIEGLSTPSLDMEPVGSDGSRWRRTDVNAPLFGSETVTVEVEGGSGEDAFPSYTQTLRAPDPLELTSPTTESGLVLAGTDLVVEWAEGNGDWIEMALQLDDASGAAEENLVVCLAEDDGCATIPSLALSVLAPSAEKPLELSVSRVVQASEQLESSVATEVRTAAIDRVDLQLGQ
jgi:hypothetical protein